MGGKHRVALFHHQASGGHPRGTPPPRRLLPACMPAATESPLDLPDRPRPPQQRASCPPARPTTRGGLAEVRGTEEGALRALLLRRGTCGCEWPPLPNMDESGDHGGAPLENGGRLAEARRCFLGWGHAAGTPLWWGSVSGKGDGRRGLRPTGGRERRRGEGRVSTSHMRPISGGAVGFFPLSLKGRGWPPIFCS